MKTIISGERNVFKALLCCGNLNNVSSKYPVTERVSSNTLRRFRNVFLHERRC